MNKVKIPLMAFFVSLPLVLGATPTIKIISPTKSPNTNGVLNASGTATGVAPIIVYYSLNGAPWTTANGSNSWSATDLLLTASTNTFSAYAQDANGVSKTNTVKFIYVVKLPITVEINGQGKVSPITNGEPLQIGKKYSVSFKADRGFGVASATLDGDAIPVTTRSLVMESNTVLAVNFDDITRPVCIITFPAVKHSVSNSPINVTGKATDNVGVTVVNYQLNGGGWNPAILTDGTNWEADGLALNVGTNAVQAFAQDAAGNVSLTNTVNFNYVSNAPAAGSGPAPASLSGMAGQVTIDGDPGPFQVCFGTSTFAQTSTNGQESTKAGTYTYTLLSSNMAQLVFTTVVPPSNGGGGGGGVALTFTNDTTAIFTNNGNGSNGVVTFTAAPNLALSPSATGVAQSVDSVGNTNTFMFGGGLFTNTDGMSYTNFGSYTATPYSPQDMVFVENLTDPQDVSNTAYVQLDFSDAADGLFAYNQFDNMDNLSNSAAGTFKVLNSGSQPAGNAPDSPAGFIWNASPTSGAAFQMCLGTSTYSRTSSDTNKDEVGVYSYVKTGANTAQFTDVEVEPLSGGPNGNGGNSSDLIDLDFTSKSAITVFRNGVKQGTISISAANNFAPASVAGHTFTGNGSTITLNTDGTFVLQSTQVTDSGNYTYTQFSPICGMINWTVSSAGEDLGKTVFVELTFTSTTAGNLVATTFNNMGQLDNVITSKFSLK